MAGIYRASAGADIPDILTTILHAWIFDTMERRIIAVSRATEKNTELQMYGLTWFYISSPPAGSA